MSKITSDTKRVQYQTQDGTSSSLTIDENIYNAIEVKHGGAKEWCKNKAREVRAALEEEAKQMKSRGELYKIVRGKPVEISVEEHIKGKVSSGVRQQAILEVIDKRYR